MQLTVLGINHHTASVDLRAQVAILPEHLAEILQAASQTCAGDVVIISTCNRTEIYAKTQMADKLKYWLSDNRQLNLDVLEPHIYQYYNEKAVQHLMRVACGLDSMVLGEPQILGQVKSALSYAQQAHTASNAISHVFEHVFHVAKKIRTQTALGAQAVSLGFAVVKLAKQMFSDLKQNTALIVATGEMNQLVAKHLLEQGIGRIILCNRTFEKAQNLAQELQETAVIEANHCHIEVIAWQELTQHLYRADIVSSCTGSLTPILEMSDVKHALKQRKHQPMLLVDLAVPRDISAQVNTLDDVYLYTVDDLQTVIDTNIEQRRKAALEAESMIHDCVLDYSKTHRTRQAAPIISQYRKQADDLRKLELEKAVAAIEKGEAAEAVLERFSQQLTAKLLHSPMQLLRYSSSLDEPHIFEEVMKGLHIQSTSQESLKE